MQLLTPREVASRLSVSPRTVYAWIAEGRLAAVHLSERVTRVPEDAVAALIAGAMAPASGTWDARGNAGVAAESAAAYGATAILSSPVPGVLPESESARILGLLAEHSEEITGIVETYGGRNVRVFGSAVHGDATEASDIDLLIDAQPGMTLFDLSEIEFRVGQIVGRKVDLLVGRSLRAEIRDRVLAEARPL